MIGDREVRPQANPTESTADRQDYLDTHSVGDNKGTGCREVVLGTIAIALLLLSILACGVNAETQRLQILMTTTAARETGTAP